MAFFNEIINLLFHRMAGNEDRINRIEYALENFLSQDYKINKIAILLIL